MSNMTLADKYFQAESRPATVVFDYRANPSLPDDFLDNRAFCLRSVLSPKECDELIALAEADGIVPPQKAAGTLRTAKRTDQYQNEELSDSIAARLHDAFQAKLANDDLGGFHGIHSNWRVVRYDCGDSFCGSSGPNG